jgi:hypothetical protein
MPVVHFTRKTVTSDAELNRTKLMTGGVFNNILTVMVFRNLVFIQKF